MKFVDFRKSLRENVAPVYVFSGGDAYFKRRGEEFLLEKCVTEPALNYSTFDGTAVKGAEYGTLLAALRSYPFLSEKRLVRVTDLYPSQKEYDRYLKDYFENPLPSTVFLIVNGAPRKGSVDLSRMPGAVAVDCSRADDGTIDRWIYTMLRRYGIDVDAESCALVREYCLSDMTRVASETEKLAAYAGEGGTITEGDVEEIVFRDTAYRIYEMSDAAGRGDYSLYLSILNDLLDRGEEPMGVIGYLCGYFRTMFEVQLVKGSDAEVASALGMKPYAVKRSRQTAARFGRDRVERMYRFLYETGGRVRSGRLSPQGAMTWVNARLFFGETGGKDGETGGKDEIFYDIDINS